MLFKTKLGYEFNMVPDKAFCKRALKNLNQLEKCPICNFDKKGFYCIPEKCEYFMEGNKK